MKDEWYADKRDLIKWGSIVSIAREKGINTIIQVAFYRPEEDIRDISIDDGNKTLIVKFPTEVWDHFRNIEDICRLEKKLNLKIIVHKETFQSDKRLQYFDQLCSKIDKISGNKIVFLDLDTGIEPKNGADLKHVKNNEIKKVYNTLRRNDVLVFYQHKRRVNGWKENTKNDFSDAVKPAKEIKTYYSEDIANDVVLFVVERT